MNYQALEQQLQSLYNSYSDSQQLLQSICDLLRERVSHYDWVGFYFKNGAKRELLLGPFSGEPTDHTVIPFGKGICGQVALSNENFIVPDVNEQDNYIACSITVKSEIVIPILKDGENIGQIDIDSHTIDAFSKTDVHLLEGICKKLATIL